MNTLRQAVQDYLNLRRGLGFKLPLALIRIDPLPAQRIDPVT